MRCALLGIAFLLAAASFAPLSAAESKVVTVTLVRWPYT
jgi:hypothetical protein